MINKIYPDTASMSIAKEIMNFSKEAESKLEILSQHHHKELNELAESLTKQVEEDFERLRLSLSIPNRLINPKFDVTYLDETGDLFLHHGPEIREANPVEALMSKLLHRVAN